MRGGNAALLAGVVLGAAAYAATAAAGLPPAAQRTAAIAVLCATWWVTEPIPIPATSIIPFAAFPLAGVLDHNEVAAAYGDTIILLLLGGFVLAAALEHTGAHRRFAFAMLRLTGGSSPRRIVLGFMLASALVSMWISNTATTLMLLPVATAVIERDRSGTLAAPLLLGVAYAASIGGMGTPIGTPPNAILMGVYREATGKELSFLDWMTVGVPTVLLLLPAAWLLLVRRLGTGAALSLAAPAPWTPAERRVIAVFAVTALAWVTRTAPFGGWSRLLGLPGAGDATVALAAVAVLFVMPDGSGGGARMLDWPTAARIPWGLLVLFGGGIAVARAFEASGLSAALGRGLAGLTAWPTVALIGAVCLGVTFLTEVTSNTATATLLMPVLAAAGAAAGVDPLLLMAPAAISASCAFMLPVATAPNAIVFGTGAVPAGRMAREGFALNLIGVVVITAVVVAVLGTRAG